jgi:hypothetical protein
MIRFVTVIHTIIFLGKENRKIKNAGNRIGNKTVIT